MIMVDYVEINEPLNTKYPTWIIAFCPDTNSFFATNERHFFWESEEEFDSEESAINYFKKQTQHFIDINNLIMGEYYPYPNGDVAKKVWLDNTNMWYEYGEE